MRGALAVVACLVLLACTTQAPTPSPQPSATALPSATPTARPTPDPDVFPDSVLGLRVHSVAETRRLAADGRLDGRFVAVAGYWKRFVTSCPYQPHLAILIGSCSGSQFEDDPATVTEYGGTTTPLGVPVVVPETSNVPSAGDAPPAAVVIAHGADSRAWQCAAEFRERCENRLVIDHFAWVDGERTVLEQLVNPYMFPDPPSMTLDEIVAVAQQPGEQVVTAVPWFASGLNDIEPRLMGQGSDVVWVVRLISGAPDADGIAAGKVVLIGDSTGVVETTVPLALDPGYDPARLVLDVKGGVGPDGLTSFSVALGDRVIAQDFLTSSLTPLALAPGDYTIRAWAMSGAITNPPVHPGCDLELSLVAGDDFSYFARWPGGGDCVWKESATPFR